MDRLRLARRLAALAAVLAVSLAGHGLSRALGRRSKWVARFLALAARACGARVRIAGAPLARDVLFVANHSSWLDILALGGATGAAFVSKAEVRGWPLLGWLAAIGGTIFVTRDTRAAARGQADALGDALASGRPAALFPEGTTGGGVTLLPFRASLFAAVAGRARCAVQPVLIDYGAEAAAIAWPGDESAGANALRLIARRGRRAVTLRFLDPIDPSATDRKALAAAAQAAIAAARAAAPSDAGPSAGRGCKPTDASAAIVSSARAT